MDATVTPASIVARPASRLPTGKSADGQLIVERELGTLIRGLRRPSPDVFHAHLPWPLAAKFPLFAALLARVPAVVATVQLFPPFTVL